MQSELGLIGLGAMGKNLLFNMADHGFSVAGYDKDGQKVQSLVEEKAGRLISAAFSIEQFIGSLTRPRSILLLVPAGKIVDDVINELIPFLSQGDLLIDGGNSFFEDTNRRQIELESKGIQFMGLGVSGGEEGARKGPSLMPGGSIDAFERLRPLLQAIAAKVDGSPCVAYIGKGSAGHFVKMVHNGIEYGLMQLIAEAYDILRNGLMLDNDGMAEIFETWNQGDLQSFLIEITAEILHKKDDLSGGYLIDVILDQSKQKGTGKWTSQNAMDLGIAIPNIDQAVSMRVLSSLKEQRLAAAALLTPPGGKTIPDAGEDFIQRLRNTLYFSFIITYAQGMQQLGAASKEYQYNLNLAEVAGIWRGGCIIRAGLLEDIRQVYQENKELPNLIMDRRFAGALAGLAGDARYVLSKVIMAGIPAAGMLAALSYFDAYRSDSLPANLIQAQRDYFGAHTYQRIDRPGTFHSIWKN